MAVNTILALSLEDLSALLPDDCSLGQWVASALGLLKLSDSIFTLIMLSFSILLFLSGRVKSEEKLKLADQNATDPTEDPGKRKKLALVRLLLYIVDILKTVPAFVGEKTHDSTKPLPDGKSADSVYAEEGAVLLLGYSTLYWLVAFVLSLAFTLNNAVLLVTYIIIPMALISLLAIFDVKQQNSIGIIINKFKGIFQGQNKKTRPPLLKEHGPTETATVQHPTEGGKEQA